MKEFLIHKPVAHQNKPTEGIPIQISADRSCRLISDSRHPKQPEKPHREVIPEGQPDTSHAPRPETICSTDATAFHLEPSVSLQPLLHRVGQFHPVTFPVKRSRDWTHAPLQLRTCLEALWPQRWRSSSHAPLNTLGESNLDCAFCFTRSVPKPSRPPSATPRFGREYRCYSMARASMSSPVSPSSLGPRKTPTIRFQTMKYSEGLPTHGRCCTCTSSGSGSRSIQVPRPTLSQVRYPVLLFPMMADAKAILRTLGFDAGIAFGHIKPPPLQSHTLRHDPRSHRSTYQALRIDPAQRGNR